MDIDESKLTSSIISRIKTLRQRTTEGALRPHPISQNHLAELIGESRTTIANIENGRQQITVTILYQICRALEVDLNDVLPNISSVASIPHHTLANQSHLVVKWGGESYTLPSTEQGLAKELEERIRKRGEVMNSKSVGKHVARERAREVFQQYKEKGGTLPVEIGKIIEESGIELIRVHEPLSDLAGMLLVDREDVFIVVNEHNPPTRRRFTLAHEFGHYLLHKDSKNPIFHRDARSSQGTVRVEIDANTFAAELLMPAEEVRAQAAKLNINFLADADNLIEKLAKTFGVSVQAMSIRLQQLGLIDIESYW